MNKPLVTIGIPVYNAEQYISYAIQSIFSQSFCDFELIITDDGSTDRTLDILRRIQDDRLVLISDGENKGISFRLNQQIEMAKGKYFVRMDADDIMFPYRVEYQLKFLEEHPSVDVIGTSAIVIDENNKVYGARGHVSNNKEEYSVNRTNGFIHPTIMGRIEWFKKHKYREDMCGCEDSDLWMRSRKESEFYEIDTPLLFYRDTQQINIKSYLNRLSRVRKMFYSNRHYYRNAITPLILIVRSYLLSCFSILCHLLNQDALFTHKRNNSVDCEKFQKILDGIVDDNFNHK